MPSDRDAEVAREILGALFDDELAAWKGEGRGKTEILAEALRKAREEARAGAVEACARLADDATSEERSDYGGGWDAACERIAEEIRALRAPRSEEK